MANIEQLAAEEEALSGMRRREFSKRFFIFLALVCFFGGWIVFALGNQGLGSVGILFSFLLFLGIAGIFHLMEKTNALSILTGFLAGGAAFILYHSSHCPSFYWGSDPSFWLSVHAGAVTEPPWTPLPTLIGQAACFLFPRHQFSLLPELSSIVMAAAVMMTVLQLFQQLRSKNLLNGLVVFLLCLVLALSRTWWDAATLGSGLTVSLGLFLAILQRALLRQEEKPWGALHLLLGLLFSTHPLWGFWGFFVHVTHLESGNPHFKTLVLPLAVGFSPYLWIFFRVNKYFPSWGGRDPFGQSLKDWRKLWENHFSTDWNWFQAFTQLGSTVGILFLLMIFLWVLHFLAWSSGKRHSTTPAEAWSLVLACILGVAFFTLSGNQTACVAAWVPLGLGSMILGYAEKGLEKPSANLFSGLFLASLLTCLFILAGMVAFTQGQSCWRQKQDFPLQHAFNLLRSLDTRTVLFLEDPFEAAASREALLMEPLQTQAVLLDVGCLNQRWYAAQCFERFPELLWPSLSPVSAEILENLVKTNQDDWNLQWGLSQTPVSWTGPRADPTVLTLLFEGKGAKGVKPEEVQYRLDLSAVPQGSGVDVQEKPYLERYALGFEALGRYLLSQNKFSQSIKALERSANLDPGRNEPRALLSQIYSQNNVLEAARLEMEKTVKEHPARIRTLMGLVEEAQKVGNESKTVALLDEMIRLNSELSDAEYHLSLIYDKLGYPEKAKTLLEASVELNPQKVDAQMRYGKWMAKLGNRLNAEEAFRSVLAVDPVNKEAQVELWKLLNQP